MTVKELLGRIKEAPWQVEAEIDVLIIDFAAPLTAADVLALLDVVGNRWLAADAPRHAMRCLAFGKLAAGVADKRLFMPYVRLLKTADPVLRETIANLLPLVNSVTEHDQLCALLAEADAAVRQLGARLISALGGRSAFERLAEMVADPAFEGRTEAMEAVRAIGGHHAVPVLAAVLRVGSTPDKIRAVRHLASPACRAKNREGAFEAIGLAVGDASEAVRGEAVTALAAHAAEDEYLKYAGVAFEDPAASVVRAAVRGLMPFTSARAHEILRIALRRGPNPVRLAVLEVLEYQASAEALSLLAEAIGHRQIYVRVRAAETLGRLARTGRIELARTVLWLLRSRDVNVRRMAVEVAASVPDPTGELWPKLLRYLYDEDWWVRERVIDAVVEMAGEQLVPHLLAHLNEDTDPLGRYYTVCVLKRLRSEQSVNALAHAAMADTDWLVRERAIEAIAGIGGDQVVPVLVHLLLQCPEQRLVCIQALQDAGSAAAAPHVALLLQAPSIDVDERLAILRCLRGIDGRAEIHAVRQHLKDASPEVRHLAAQILTAWDVRVGPQPTGTKPSASGSVLDQLLVALAEWQGDDLILSPGRPPFMKRLGQVHAMSKNDLTREQIEACLGPLLTPYQVEELDALRDVDFSHERVTDGLRFRVNVFQGMGGISAVFRLIRRALPQLQDLGLPPIVATLAELKNGLVLVGGPTGSGKSTTLAALIGHINAVSARHVVTFEDPIETVHARKLSLINQREVGRHTPALEDALRATLRQDPDVILVGELRDAASVAFAVTAAETGHLVFGTVHTVSAATSVDRLINACPPSQHDHIRGLLAGALRAVVCQHLHTRRNAPGRVLSAEVMLNSDAIANLIRKGKAFQIPSVIATSAEQGMQLMDTDLMRLVREGAISAEDAYLRAAQKKDFEKVVSASGPASGIQGGA
jgi:twitching motility protein PilT